MTDLPSLIVVLVGGGACFGAPYYAFWVCHSIYLFLFGIRSFLCYSLYLYSPQRLDIFIHTGANLFPICQNLFIFKVTFEDFAAFHQIHL